MSVEAGICEVRIDGAWIVVDLAEAHRSHRGAEKRCASCGGAIRTAGGYTFGGRTTLTHLRSHPGCRTKAHPYAASEPRHPDAIG